jgi:hypothetical protein
MSECDTTWWTLGNVLDWVRGIDPTATIGQIRIVLEKLCGSDRVHTRGHRRVYGYDRPVPIDHRDPTFVHFADECGEPRSSFDEISATEWKDLTFFARATHVTNEPYHVALISALDRLTSPVELRSVSNCRLAWKDVEFRRVDVLEVWPEDSDAAEPNEANCEPQAGAVGEATGEGNCRPGALLHCPTGICAGGTRDASRSWRTAARALRAKMIGKRPSKNLADASQEPGCGSGANNTRLQAG